MSSDVVYKDNQDKMSYGIKILKGVMEMGLKQDVKQVFKSMCTILRHLNENDGHKFYLPVLHIFNQNGNLNKPPRITSDNFFKWESQKLINHSDFNNDTQ
jgi:hypothetical protein